MLTHSSPTQSPAWQKLQQHAQQMQTVHMRDLFHENPRRFEAFSIQEGEILFDYSKNLCTPETFTLFQELATDMRLADAITQMFSGEKINETENRAVLHTALRNQDQQPILVDGVDVMPEVRAVLTQMQTLVQAVHSGAWTGYTGKPITDIVNIGIGGSDLGPYMVTEALLPYKHPRLTGHFISNVDATHCAETLKHVSAETTLFIVASKTFTTQETMTNAQTARAWFLERAKDEKHIAKHFIAASTNTQAVAQFGIDPQNMFRFWDWVGGRYSLWSAVGISIALLLGFEHYMDLHKGAFAADTHFRTQPFARNIPFIQAALGVWYNNFFDAASYAILPYDQYMHRFAAYFQQADMESNGKSVGRNTQPLTYQSGPIVWGEPGTNGQHAFYQLIHQGTKCIPCDFIAPAVSHNPLSDHHEKLLANFFAQSEALMMGKTPGEVQADLLAAGKNQAEVQALLPFKVFAGNKPSNSFLIRQITPHTLGQLIAFYEHKVFTQGVLWNVFSFDQWGVELGKVLASSILPELQTAQPTRTHDSSTNGLINAWKSMRA